MANREPSASGSASGSTPSVGTNLNPHNIVGTRPPGARDPAWKHAVLGASAGSVICLRCTGTIHGGINRLKYHLAGITHRDTKPCENTTEEIKRQMNAYLAAAEEKKLQRERTKAAIAAAISGRDPEPAEDLEGIVGSLRGPRIRNTSRPPIVPPTFFTSSSNPSASTTTSPLASSSRLPHSFFVPRNTPGAQPSLEATGWNREVHAQASKACADFWYFNNIPFNVASSPYWENMVSALTIAGKGYKAPSRKDLAGSLLVDATERAALVVEEQKQEWKKYGCTILSDGWTDGRNRTIINFLVASKGDVVFLKSVDASNKIKNTETLSHMLEEVVMEVGIENVVQIITDNAAAYVAAGRVLEGKHPTIFWSPCAAHCLDLLLEDIGKLDWVTPTVENARSITKFIYNHPWVLNLMRSHTQGKELVRSGATRFATVFLTLQSILGSLTALKQMFVSQDWLDSSYAKKPEGERVAAIVFDNTFYQTASEIVKVSEPLVRVLRLVDGDQNPMGFIYEAMDRAKEAIKHFYQGDSLKFDPIWEIVDKRWNNQLHQPIHAAGYLLNPQFFLSDSFSDPTGEVMAGFSTCVERMTLELEERDLIFAQLESYREGEGVLFSSVMAKRGRVTMAPDVWWKNWGSVTPNLQRIALRILCQPCSASSCERNWSLFEAIHTKKRNKLAQKRLNDLVFVQYNLRLRIRKIEDKSHAPIDLDDIDPYSDWTVQDEHEPLFTTDEILDFERQAMEAGAVGDAATGLEDIAEGVESETESESEPEETLPVPPSRMDVDHHLGASSSRPPEHSRFGPTLRTRASATPHVGRSTGKRKM